jgi:FkbM family methyltransferase
MRALLEQNVIGLTNVSIVGQAVGRHVGSASFVLESAGEVSHLARTGDSSGDHVVVEVTTIDAFVQSRRLTKVSAIKIDIEGFDIDAIAGAHHTMAKFRPLILTEASPEGALFDLLAPVNYVAMAFVRGQNDRKKQFSRIPAGGVPGFDCKMLFLAPSERLEELTYKSGAV